MFERFTEGARALVVDAQAEARALEHDWIGTEHLLLAALRPASPTASSLADLGLTLDASRAHLRRPAGRVDDGSREALRSLGIEIDEVRRRVEETFGPGALDGPEPRRRGASRQDRPGRRRRGRGGHIPFTARARAALEQSLREAVRLRSREIRAEHLVLATMRSGGVAEAVVAGLGVSVEDVRRAMLAQLGRAA